MELEQFTDVEEALEYLKQQGYTHTFSCCPEGWHCGETKEIFWPEEMQVVACHRFQKRRGTHTVSMLYVVDAPNGSKGIILDNCSTYGNARFGEFLVRMKLNKIQPGSRPEVR
ncbi:hypothetical protein ACFSC6_17100 [Rufibacter sediminis]|uniref:Uncharacterized protein n=1 Tax=Rufibacter sediminis TaxID=2762756 RepID=A0ABR6VV06_9BACT|nr:hypothetical protein [Rufibacter sediminis]MBC3541032.1 hypothetical protein [Rufibacter sediminis]